MYKPCGHLIACEGKLNRKIIRRNLVFSCDRMCWFDEEMFCMSSID
jgi:hypothetical protein